MTKTYLRASCLWDVTGLSGSHCVSCLMWRYWRVVLRLRFQRWVFTILRTTSSVTVPEFIVIARNRASPRTFGKWDLAFLFATHASGKSNGSSMFCDLTQHQFAFCANRVSPPRIVSFRSWNLKAKAAPMMAVVSSSGEVFWTSRFSQPCWPWSLVSSDTIIWTVEPSDVNAAQFTFPRRKVVHVASMSDTDLKYCLLNLVLI